MAVTAAAGVAQNDERRLPESPREVPGVQQQQQQQHQSQQEQQPAPATAEQGQLHAQLDDAAEHYAHTLFVQRLRTGEDRARFGELFARAWGRPMALPGRVQVCVLKVCVNVCADASVCMECVSSGAGVCTISA